MDYRGSWWHQQGREDKVLKSMLSHPITIDLCFELFVINFFGPVASEAHSTGVHGLVLMSHTVRLLPVYRSYQPLYIPILRHAGVSGPLVDHTKPWGMRNTGSSLTIYLGHTNVAALLSRVTSQREAEGTVRGTSSAVFATFCRVYNYYKIRSIFLLKGEGLVDE